MSVVSVTFFAVVAMFALVSCGGGIVETDLENKKAYTEDLKAAVEDKDAAAVVEATKDYIDASADLIIDNIEFHKESEKVNEDFVAVMKDLAKADFVKETDEKEIERAIEEAQKRIEEACKEAGVDEKDVPRLNVGF